MTQLSEIFAYLSEPEKMGEFLSLLSDGVWDEWDCGLSDALTLFGEQEFAIVAKSAMIAAQHHERLDSRDEARKDPPSRDAPPCQ